MKINISQFNEGTTITILDDLKGWHVPLQVYGDFEPGELQEASYPAKSPSFQIDLMYVHAADGYEDVIPNIMLKVNLSDLGRKLEDEICSELAKYIDESIKKGAL